MVVISGCPRSGTSMMTLLIIKLLSSAGYEIIGDEFPQRRKMEDIDARRRARKPQENDGQFELRRWLQEQQPAKDRPQRAERLSKAEKAWEKTVDLNPMGFWECRYTVKGTGWNLGLKEELSGKKIMKIVSQGLTNTPPNFIDKMVYMLRHPRKVATSQEGLKRGALDSLMELDKRFRVHDTTMFCQVTQAAARYFVKTGVKPLIVEYDDFLNDPDTGIARLIQYFGEGEAEPAREVVKEKLRRSEAADLTDGAFAEAEAIYEMMKAGDFSGAMAAKTFETMKKTAAFPCPRIGGNTVFSHCTQCKKDPMFALQLKAYAVSQGIAWEKMPCAFDCGYNPDAPAGEHISIEKSIKENHWLIEGEKPA